MSFGSSFYNLNPDSVSYYVFHDLVSFCVSDDIFNARLKMMNSYLSVFLLLPVFLNTCLKNQCWFASRFLWSIAFCSMYHTHCF